MPFIGSQPTRGAYLKCDAITTSATASYTLQVNGGSVNPASANNMIVSLNGVIQAPQDAYTISGSTITFDSALTSSDVIDFILILGNTDPVGTPADGTITTNKLQNNAITTAKIANNAITSAILPTGSVLQVQSVNHKGELTTSSTSHTPITELAVTITPTSTSSKVLLMFQGYLYTSTWTRYLTMSAQRNIGGAGATDISGTTLYTDNNADGLLRTYDADSHVSFRNGGFNFVDSPNTTSSIVYNPTFRRGTDSATCYIGHANMITTFIAMEIA